MHEGILARRARPRVREDQTRCARHGKALPFRMPRLLPLPRRMRRLPALALLVVATIGTVVGCGRADAADRSATPNGVTAVNDTLSDSVLFQRADRGRIIGPDSAIWVVMISDYQCPYCKQWHDQSMAALKRDYIDAGKVRFAYLHLPLESIHPHAKAEAEASLCAGVQGQFWAFSEALFASQGVVKTMSSPVPLFSRIARELKLDEEAFGRCRTSPMIAKLVANDIRQATQAGVQSTPSFLVGDFLVQGAIPYPDFRRAVDTALVVARSRANRAR